MRRPWRTQIHRSLLEVAGLVAAHVLAEEVVLRLPVAAANRIGVDRLLARGNCAADDEAGRKADAKAEARVTTAATRVSFLGGGSDAAGDNERGDSESSNFGLDRH